MLNHIPIKKKKKNGAKSEIKQTLLLCFFMENAFAGGDIISVSQQQIYLRC